MAYGGLITPTTPATASGGYKGLNSTATPAAAPSPSLLSKGLGTVKSAVTNAAPNIPAPIKTAANILTSEVTGAISGAQSVPITPKSFSVTAPGQATIDTFNNAFKAGTDSIGTNMAAVVDSHNTALQRGVAAGEVGLQTVNTLFSTALSPLQGLATVPGVGYVVDGVNKLFAAIGGGSSKGAGTLVDSLPVSQQTKDTIKPLAQDTAALAAQIVVGGELGDFGKGALSKMSDNSKTILTQLQNDPAIQDSIAKQVEKSGAPEPQVTTAPEKLNIVPRDYVTNNFSQLKQDYVKRVTQLFGTPTIVSADEFKHVIPNGLDGSIESHKASTLARDQYFNELIGSQKGKGNNTVLFTGGPTGVGKTSALRDAGIDPKQYAVVLDSNLNRSSSPIKFQQAIDNGYKVDVVFTHRDPVESWINGVLPRVSSEGRTLPASEHVMRHTEAPENIAAAHAQQVIHGDKFNIIHIDNTGVSGASKVVSLDNIPKFDYNDLHEKLISGTNNAVAEGRLAPEKVGALHGTTDSGRIEQTGIERPARAGSTTQTLKPIEGTGELKTRGAALSTEASAIEKGLTDNLGQLPEYQALNFKEVASKVADAFAKDPEASRAIAMGDKAAPKGTTPEMFAIALEKEALAKGDIQTLQELANSKLTTAATTMGQRIASYAQRDEISPVKAIQDVQDAREAALKAKGTDIVKEVEKTVKEIKKQTAAARSPRPTWEDFVKQITCNV